ncbi:unnamed protein product [Eruca vesicaria subsp. sativa]|uniref:Uncharacterized protein n=1 Tax=Eruca vesicaria subsp. sativa TaxID=29727 RepID=A0ABC8L1A3_ERUVS|nr:unnamed protein product [Eruca vesicaria subsp. sativa]
MFHELDQVLLQVKEETRIVPTEIVFCNVINYFDRGRLPTRALHVFDEMPPLSGRGFAQPSPSSHELIKNVVFTVHGSEDEVIPVSDAKEFAKIIHNHKLVPSARLSFSIVASKIKEKARVVAIYFIL